VADDCCGTGDRGEVDGEGAGGGLEPGEGERHGFHAAISNPVCRSRAAATSSPRRCSFTGCVSSQVVSPSSGLIDVWHATRATGPATTADGAGTVLTRVAPAASMTSLRAVEIVRSPGAQVALTSVPA